MVQGLVIFAVEGRLPLFSVFFTPEGNDERMQARQQAIIRRVHEDYLLRMQYSRDVILAKPLLLPSFLREAGHGSRAVEGSSSAGTANGANSSSSIEKRHQSPGKGHEEAHRCGSSHPGGPPAAAAVPAAAAAPATAAPPYAAAAPSPPNAGELDAAAAASADAAVAVDTKLPSLEEKEEFPWDSVFPPPSAAAGGAVAVATDPTDAPLAYAVHSVAAATAAAAAAGEVMDGLLHVTTSSLFSSARLIIWKHVEGVCYSALCGAMDNVALVLSFLSLLVHCLDEAFSLAFPASTLPLKQQLLTRPDIVLLVLHTLLPGGQVLVINSSYAAFLKKKIRASVAVSSLGGSADAAGQLSP